MRFHLDREQERAARTRADISEVAFCIVVVALMLVGAFVAGMILKWL